MVHYFVCDTTPLPVQTEPGIVAYMPSAFVDARSGVSHDVYVEASENVAPPPDESTTGRFIVGVRADPAIIEAMKLKYDYLGEFDE